MGHFLRWNASLAEQEDSASAEDKEVAMKKQKTDSRTAATAAVLVLAEIKAATDAFNQGETNAFDALDAIGVAIDAYRDGLQARRDAA
jgi:hypothetical protein